MSYIVDVIAPLVPAADTESQQFLSELRQRYPEDKQDPAAALVKLHALLTERFPCLSSYAVGDPEAQECPWTDVPLLAVFRGEMGRLVIRRHVDEVMAFLVPCATHMGLSVADPQNGAVYRPPLIAANATYKVTLQGVQPGHDHETVVDALVPLFKGNRDQVSAMLAMPQAVIKKDVDLATATKYKEALRQRGCVCLVAPMPRNFPAVADEHGQHDQTQDRSIAPAAAASKPAAATAQGETPAPAAPELTTNFSSILLRRFLARDLGLSLNAPSSWHEAGDDQFQLTDMRTGARFAASGRSQPGAGLGQWLKERTELVARQTPHLEQHGDPYPLRSREWGERIQATMVEFRGRAGDSEEESHLLLCCLRCGDMLIALSIASTAAVYEQNAGFYRWLLLTQMDVQNVEPAVPMTVVDSATSTKSRRAGLGLTAVALLLGLAYALTHSSHAKSPQDTPVAAPAAAASAPAAAIPSALQARQTQLADDPNPCPLVGVWNATREGVQLTLTLQDNGDFISRPVSHSLSPEPATTGRWKVDGQTIHWSYASGPAGQPSSGIRVDGPGKVTLTDGDVETRYEFAGPVAAPRCTN